MKTAKTGLIERAISGWSDFRTGHEMMCVIDAVESNKSGWWVKVGK